MGDMREVYDDMKQNKQQRHELKRQENLQFLEINAIPWKWAARLSDHILIDGEIDYYLGKTYWFNRKSKKRGYAMLHQLLKDRVSKNHEVIEVKTDASKMPRM